MAIHNTIEVMRPNIVMLIGGLILVVSGGFMFFGTLDKVKNPFLSVVCFFVSGFIVAAGLSCMMYCNNSHFQKPTGQKQLEVTFIDDEIPVNFLDKYEIIEQRGEIFVLEEK